MKYFKFSQKLTKKTAIPIQKFIFNKSQCLMPGKFLYPCPNLPNYPHFFSPPANAVPVGTPQPDTASYPGPALYPPIAAVSLSPDVISRQPTCPSVWPFAPTAYSKGE